jgi:UPF0271 protein
LRVKVDLNADMGESCGESRIGSDEELVGLVSSASLACGFHGGDSLTMRKTILMCKARGVGIGAHPSFPDREGFGRREIEMPPVELEADVLYQVAALKGMAESLGVGLQHVKPHGALYNMASLREDYAGAVVRAVAAISKELVMVAQPDSAADRLARSTGLRVAREGFPERGYLDDGRLAPRGTPGSLVTDPGVVAERALEMAAHGQVTSVSGRLVSVKVDTLCIHSDTPGAPAIAREVRRRLTEEGIEVLPLKSVIEGSRI